MLPQFRGLSYIVGLFGFNDVFLGLFPLFLGVFLHVHDFVLLIDNLVAQHGLDHVLHGYYTSERTVFIEDGWVLKIYPRSGLGFKFRLQLNNTVGIIDSDYYNSDNEGHIFIKVTNDTNEGRVIEIPAGTGFAQGIFVEYGITFDDEADGVRNGGFGSTT